MGGIGGVFGAAAVVAMAFAMGFAVRRGSVCMVEASRLLVIEGRPASLGAFVCAAAAALLMIVPLAWGLARPSILYPDYGMSLTLVAGGAIFGIGAFVNGGCAFGTLTRLSGGQMAYAATIAASIAGAMSALELELPLRLAAQAAQRAAGPPGFSEPGIAGGIAVALSLVLVGTTFTAAHLRNLRMAVTGDTTRLQPVAAMVVIGCLSGLLFAVAGSWTHLSLLRAETDALVGSPMAAIDERTLLGGSALLAGAVFAAWRSGRFKLVLPNARQLLGCTTGGAMMGFGAALVPGGNGALITYGVASGSASATLALFAMVAMLCLLFVPKRLRVPRR